MKTFIGLSILILIIANKRFLPTHSVLPETQSATITVTTVDDEADIIANDQCSLREAIISTNENADIGGCVASGVYASNLPDIILVPAGTYTLTRDSFFSLQDQDWGDLDIYGSVIIKGEATTRIEANSLFIEPLMFIGPKNDSDPIPNVHLENLEISTLIEDAGYTTLRNAHFSSSKNTGGIIYGRNVPPYLNQLSNNPAR
jgi:CSLREA domain-containing protein